MKLCGSVSDDGDYDRKPDGGRSKGTRQKKKGKQQERVLEHPEIGNKIFIGQIGSTFYEISKHKRF